MSVPNSRLNVDLSPQARQDFSDILLTSRRQWGAAQRSKYKTAIDQALVRLTKYPEIGRERDDLIKDLRALAVEQHIIYYYVRPNVIRVERILHARMDASAEFSP